MKTALYQIFDRVSEMPTTPIVGFPRDEAAIRWFQEVAAIKDNPVNKYPEDHTLLKLGFQDISSGQIDAHTPTAVYDGETMLADIRHKQQAAAARERATAASPSAANDNTAANAETAVLKHLRQGDDLRIEPTPEELSCLRCHKHYTVHPNGLCANGERFAPTEALMAKYREYLKLSQ